MSEAQPYAGCPIEHGYTGVAKRLALMRQFADWRGKRVLDVGCGTGAYTLEIAREAARVCGIDITQRFLRAFQSHLAGAPPIHLARSASEQLPFADASFDVIVCIETLEHVADEQATLQEMRRVLRHDGVLLLTIPNKRYPFEAHGIKHMRHGHLIPFVSWLPKGVHAKIASARIYTEDDIRALLRQAGWATTGIDWLLPPLDQLKHPTLQGQLRRMLKTLEYTPLRRFGVSLIVAAHKAA